MDLLDFVDNALGTSGGTDLTQAGASSQKVLSLTGNESLTRSLIATMFWQSFMSSRALGEILGAAGASSGAIQHREAFVVAHGSPSGEARYDLIIFDPGFSKSQFSRPDVRPPRDFLIEGSRRFVRDRVGLRSGLLGQVAQMHTDVTLEANNAQPFGVIVAPLPPLMFTATVPSPCLSVVGIAGAGGSSTAGVIVTDEQGRAGVTAALHAVGPGQSTAYVDGVQGTIVSQDPISDSCFIEVPGIIFKSGSLTPTPLSGVTPRSLDPVSFEGVVSKTVNTHVISWSPDLPFVLPQSQLKVLTNLSTAQGDSGAALIDGQNKLIGFSFYCTYPRAVVQFSTWIWAESVFIAHKLH